MFAILVLEREPTRPEALPAVLTNWMLTAGAIAAAALLIYFLAYLIKPPKSGGGSGSAGRTVLTILVLGAILGTLPFVLARLLPALGVHGAPELLAPPNGVKPWLWQGLAVLAAMAIAAVLVPVINNLARLRMRRIWALAKLSFKEAVRRRVLWAFSALILVVLFASWFLDHKPEDQVRNYVRVTYWAMSPLLLLAAGLLAAFSIPDDLKRQTMQTIVTKPVERFEIVLGRCLGYVMLMSLVLGVLTAAGLVFVFRGIGPEARAESYKARVPLFGDLKIYQGKKEAPGISVGREWDYRKYISGGATNESATWSFSELPTGLDSRPSVPCEFSFDIFRTTKGVENKGIFCTFTVETDRWDPSNRNAYEQDRDNALNAPDQKVLERARQEGWDADKLRAVRLNPVAEKYGYYELASKEIFDYHTLSFEIPAGLFKGTGTSPNRSGAPRPPLSINVRCESPTQYLGLARHDLYLLDANRAFEWNFFKGAIGLWFRICLITVVAVTLSTYLSGIISFLTTMALYMFGLLVHTEFIRMLAEGRSDGGGPLEAAIRLSQGAALLAPLDQTPTLKIAVITDQAYAFILRMVLHLIPNVERYDLTNYIAEGFDISGSLLVWDNLLPLAGFLIPCVVLAFYLFRSREIAA